MYAPFVPTLTGMPGTPRWPSISITAMVDQALPQGLTEHIDKEVQRQAEQSLGCCGVPI